MFAILLVEANLYIFISFFLQVDLSGPGCDKIGGYSITDEDEIVSVKYVPNYNAQATRDHCDVTVRAATGRRIQYLISLIKFNECGIEVRIFDLDGLNTVPKVGLACRYSMRMLAGLKLEKEEEVCCNVLDLI